MLNCRRPRRLHIMADYGSAGLWEHNGNPLDPATLPLNAERRTRMARWCARFETSELGAFATMGRMFARAVETQLRSSSSVYFGEAAAARAKYQGTPASYDTEIP